MDKKTDTFQKHIILNASVFYSSKSTIIIKVWEKVKIF